TSVIDIEMDHYGPFSVQFAGSGPTLMSVVENYCGGLRAGPDDHAVFEILSGTTIERVLITGRPAEGAVLEAGFIPALADIAVDPEAGLAVLAVDSTTLEALHVAPRVPVFIPQNGVVGDRVAERAGLPFERFELGPDTLGDRVRAGLSGPVDVPVLELHPAALAIRC